MLTTAPACLPACLPTFPACLPACLQVEGDIVERLTAQLEPSGGIHTQAVRFVQGDACSLPRDLGGPFDAVLMSNLLDRVPDPEQCLASISEQLSPGGVLVIVSPFSWAEEHTDRR